MDEECNYINAKSSKEHILNTTVLATDNIVKNPRGGTKIRGNETNCLVNSFFPQKFFLKGYCGGILYFVRLGEANQMKQMASIHISACHLLAVCVWISSLNSHL